MAKHANAVKAEEQRRLFAAAYAKSGNTAVAAKAAGYSMNTAPAILARPQTKALIRAEMDKALYCEAAPLALGALIGILRSPKSTDRNKISAARVVLDRVELDSGSGDKSASEMSREEIIAKIAELEAARAAQAIVIDGEVVEPDDDDLADDEPPETDIFG